jgi:glutathione S-transferase
MYQLYYHPGKASLTPHIFLEELGVPYELVMVDMPNGMHRSEAFLTLNPAGSIPVLVEDELVLSETVAILIHLSDLHADLGLAPEFGTAARAKWYKWLAYLGTTLHPDLMIYHFPQRHADDDAAMEQIKAHAYERVSKALDLIDAHLRHNAEHSRGPWLLGTQYTAADCYLYMFARWSRNLPHPAHAREYLRAFIRQIVERPALQRACEQEGLAPALS